VDIQEEVIEIYGPESSGKLLDTSCYCRSSKAGGIAAFIDAEHAFDRNYAEKLGVDIENLIISQPDNGEQASKLNSFRLLICSVASTRSEGDD
jgi:recombination protein RecA